jgi:hypothetical protein
VAAVAASAAVADEVNSILQIDTPYKRNLRVKSFCKIDPSFLTNDKKSRILSFFPLFLSFLSFLPSIFLSFFLSFFLSSFLSFFLSERQKDRKTERQKDRKTERQKDRKTERQKDRKTERQKKLEY